MTSSDLWVLAFFSSGWHRAGVPRRLKFWQESSDWEDSGQNLGNLTQGLIAPLESAGSVDILFYRTASDDHSIKQKELIWFNQFNLKWLFSAPWFHEIFLQFFWPLLLRISYASVSCFWLADLKLAEQDTTRLHQWKFRLLVVTHESQFCVCAKLKN